MIRPAHENDRLSIGKVYSDTWKAAYHGIVSDQFLSCLNAENCAPPTLSSYQAFVYVHDGQVCGVTHFGAARDALCGNSGEIYSIYVLPEFWSQGAGCMLFQAAVQKLRNSGFPSVCLWALKDNLRAIRFYERMGMTRFSERVITIGGQSLPEIGFMLHFDQVL